jgi:hypothetical protein
MPSGPVKVSFFGGIAFGRLNAPLQTEDSMLLVASPEDLLATELKAILDRAEAKDYRDISALIDSGTSLERSLAAFSKMYGRDPALPLRAIGFFKDGDLPSLPQRDQELLKAARDRVSEIPDVSLIPGTWRSDRFRESMRKSGPPTVLSLLPSCRKIALLSIDTRASNLTC